MTSQHHCRCFSPYLQPGLCVQDTQVYLHDPSSGRVCVNIHTPRSPHMNHSGHGAPLTLVYTMLVYRCLAEMTVDQQGGRGFCSRIDSVSDPRMSAACPPPPSTPRYTPSSPHTHTHTHVATRGGGGGARRM